jgi:hypothetical protein
MAGCTATTVMTAVMKVWHARLPAEERYPLPRERITARLARRAGFHAHPERPGWEWKTYVAHYAYGMSAGVAHHALTRRLPGPAVVKGVGFGLTLWAGSYLGWLPAVGAHPPATREPRGRNVLMIAAHVVWGAVVGVLSERNSST